MPRRSCGRCWAEDPLYRPASQSATGPSSTPTHPQIRHGERRAGPGPAALPPDWGSRQSAVDGAAHPRRHQAPGTGTSCRARHRPGQARAVHPQPAPRVPAAAAAPAERATSCLRIHARLQRSRAQPPCHPPGCRAHLTEACAVPDAAAAQTKAEGHAQAVQTQGGDKGVAPVRPAATSAGVQIDAQASFGVTFLLRMAERSRHVAWRQRDDGRGRIGFLG